MECGLSSLVYSYKIVYRDNMYIIAKFNACLPLQPKHKDLSNNAQGYIDKVEKRFEQALQDLEQPDALTNEFLNESNAYLHIQGHQLYKLVVHIGTILCRGTGIAFKSDILDTVLHAEGYEEINHLQSDLVQITTGA